MSSPTPYTLAIAIVLAAVGSRASHQAHAAKIVRSEFIYETAPFPECHASTLVEVDGQLVASWFGGLRESDPSVGIWVSRHDGTSWSKPIEVANGESADPGQKRQPAWNPVLHRLPDGRVQLYYKLGPNPRTWWGMVIESGDGGSTWSQPVRLPDGILGPIKNKPITLADGRLLSGSSTEHNGWRVHFEWSDDRGGHWQRTSSLPTGDEFGIIQPTIFTQKDGTLVALCRSRQGKIVKTTSNDRGETWTAPVAIELPNPNSGIDGVTLRDGRHALIYNHTSRGRTPLNLALAIDDQWNWQPAVTLETEPGEYSYPAIIQTRDGMLHMTYTWKREKVKHVVVDPE